MKIAFIGLGNMGGPMALNLHKAGHEIQAFDLSKPACDKLADMATELVAARQMVRMAAAKLDAGAPDASTYCAMAKRFATDVGFHVCNEALQLHGGYGSIREYPLERLLRDARVHQILEGTNEIMRVIIARRMLEGDAPDAVR